MEEHMGWNTTLVICNDAIESIRQDSSFSERLANGVTAASLMRPGNRIDLGAGGFVNAASIVASHHADETTLVTVGGNLGICHLVQHGWKHNEEEFQRALLARWAEQLGMKLVPAGQHVPLSTGPDELPYPRERKK
jgi:hypothetical protein